MTISDNSSTSPTSSIASDTAAPTKYSNPNELGALSYPSVSGPMNTYSCATPSEFFSSTKVKKPAGAPSYHNKSPSAPVNGKSIGSSEPSVILASKSSENVSKVVSMFESPMCSNTFISSEDGSNSSPSSDSSAH